MEVYTINICEKVGHEHCPSISILYAKKLKLGLVACICESVTCMRNSYATLGSFQPSYASVGGCAMWIGIAILLLLLWAGGLFAFHVAGFFIHILLILAVASFVIHFITGRRTAV
jgi:hypothetical protein